MSDQTILLRLRSANPVPVAPAVRNDELLVAITALPADPRLAHAPRPALRRRAVAVAVAVVFAALLASAAYAISQWVGGDAVGPRVTKREYLRAQHQLTLPPGQTWPQFHLPPPNTLTGRGGGGGRAVAVSQNAWECYWVKAIKDGDVAAQRRAHKELTALLDHNVIVAPQGASENWTPPNPPKTPYAVFADDGGYEWVQKTYAAAAAGHPQNLIASCRANAP
jgi:hypothetical protein